MKTLLLILPLFTISCSTEIAEEDNGFIKDSIETENPFLVISDSMTLAASYCDSIQLITDKWKESHSNYFINRIVPQLEMESGVEATCSKGLAGHIYSDSAFNYDVAKWLEYFDCD